MPKHVMADLETWGILPGSDLRSIGAVEFDPVNGTVVTDNTFYVATSNPTGYWYGHGVFRRFVETSPGRQIYKRKYQLRRDSKTVKWWREPEQAAASQAFDNPVDLKTGLAQFADWIGQFGDDVRVWGHGANFDVPLLNVAYDACDLVNPIHYRAARDTRTLFELAGIEDVVAFLNETPGPLGIPHHALDDAICQAYAVNRAWAMVRK